MKPWALLIAVIAVALGVAAWALRTPTPAPADAPASAFSATRAMADVAMMAQRPHPMGSPEQSGVQEALFARMQALGLAPAFRPFQSAAGPGRNLLGVLPGSNRAAPAVLLMAHSDSVTRGPGAADDAAGVAAVLEIVRALKASGPLQRDVMVLITDGEEPGMLGAAAFFSADEARAHVGVALNLEAIRYIDSSGIATLIEVLNDSRRRNMQFVLFGLSTAVEEVFRLTHVFRIFRIVQTEQEALGGAPAGPVVGGA